MIWESVGLMTAIDVAILTMVGVSFTAMRQQLFSDSEKVVRLGAALVTGGLGLIAVFYGLDLFIMWILPVVTSRLYAMSVMEEVHLNLLWVVMMAGVGCICAGFTIAARHRSGVLIVLRSQQAELAALEHSLRYILDNNPAVTYRAKTSGDFGATYVSAGITSQLGFHPRDFTENPQFWVDHLHPEDKPRVLAEMSQVVDNGSGISEYRFQQQDGTHRWIRGECQLDAEKEPPELIGYWIDITERKEAEEALRRAQHELEAHVTERTAELNTANEELTAEVAERKRVATELRNAEQHMREQRDQLEQLYRTAPVGLALVDKDLRYIRVNDRLAAINGLPAAEHVGLKVRDILPEPLATAAEAPFRRVIDRGEPLLNIEMTGPTATTAGTRHHWLTNYYPVVAKDGTVRGASVIVQDITGRKNAEDLLRDSEARFRMIYQHAPVMIDAFDNEGRCVMFNKECERVFGWTAEEVLEVDPENWTIC